MAMELLRDIVKYLLGTRGWQLARPGMLALVAAGALAAALASTYFDGGRGPPAEPVVADAVVHDRPLISPAAVGSSAATTAPGKAASAAGPVTGSALIRALQSGLARADCYDGQISGYWTRKSRDAMGRFVAVLNAKLPVDLPDHTLLALVESNPAARCTDGQQPNTAALTPASPAAATRVEPAAAPSAIMPAVPPPVTSVTPPAQAPVEAAAPERPERTAKPPPVQEASKPQLHARRKKTENAFDGVAKSMTRNFKSLQRSLSSLFK